MGIARIIQCGWYKEVRVKELDSHAIKGLLVSRTLLVKIKRDVKNQIRGLLKNLGINIAVRATRALTLTNRTTRVGRMRRERFTILDAIADERLFLPWMRHRASWATSA